MAGLCRGIVLGALKGQAEDAEDLLCEGCVPLGMRARQARAASVRACVRASERARGGGGGGGGGGVEGYREGRGTGKAGWKTRATSGGWWKKRREKTRRGSMRVAGALPC